MGKKMLLDMGLSSPAIAAKATMDIFLRREKALVQTSPSFSFFSPEGSCPGGRTTCVSFDSCSYIVSNIVHMVGHTPKFRAFGSVRSAPPPPEQVMRATSARREG